jgi:hypothetical protein
MKTTKTLVIPGLLVAAGLLAAPDAAHAVLCKSKKGGLLVRPQCKRKEVELGPEQVGALGLKGEKGDPGPVGPSGGGLRMVDAAGKDVGAVTSVYFSSSYGSTASVVREMTVPGSTGPEWFSFGVNADGFAKSQYGNDFLYAAHDCQGQPYLALYGETAPANDLGHDVAVAQDGATGTFTRSNEGVKQQYYDVFTLESYFGNEDLQGECAQGPAYYRGPGRVVGDFYPCGAIGHYCLDCCSPTGHTSATGAFVGEETFGSPAHTIDLDKLGLTPPFTLKR